MKPCVFIHTNSKQIIGALVAQYALKRNSRQADAFDVRIISTEDYPFLAEREGQPFLRDGAIREWRNDDLQSFTPLRFMPPELMGYQGRALLIDPDVFAVADVWKLLSRDMHGKAVLCRLMDGPRGRHGYYATSVMLLDCSKLTHWHCRTQFDEMFRFQRDYVDWVSLRLEPQDSIGQIEPEWNDFDRLTSQTKMLHNTRRITQPWKTGLPIDFTVAETVKASPLSGWLLQLARRVVGPKRLIGRYFRHPDSRQERFFFGLLRECVERGIVPKELLEREIARDHVRHDAFDVLRRVPPLATA